MNGTPWTAEQIALLRELYPDSYAADVARACGHSKSSVYGMAKKQGLTKSPQFIERELARQGERLKRAGAATRIKPGTPPPNKGLRRPGWSAGRMRETQFKKGGTPPNKDPEFYVIGALRVNSDGYIDMRVSFEKGARGWKALHRILWEDANGPVPEGHIVTFRDRDSLNVCIENLELITLADNARRNSIHNLPAPLKQSIQLLGALKRTINRRTRDAEHRGSEDSPVRNAGGAEGQNEPDGSRPRKSGRGRRPGDRRLGAGRSGNGARYRGKRRQRILAKAERAAGNATAPAARQG